MTRPRPVNVLHVFGRMGRGGAELRTVELLRYFDPREVRLHFCTLSGLPGSLDAEIRGRGGQVHPCRLGWGFRTRFGDLVRSQGIHVVQSHVHYPSGLILREAARLGVKFRITHFRNESDGRPRTWQRRAQQWVLRRWIGRYSHAILAVSESAMAGAWSPAWRTDPLCRVIYNGIAEVPPMTPGERQSTREALGVCVDTALYIHAARMDPAKNHRRVLRIFSEVMRLNPSAQLLMVGRTKEPHATSLLAEARRLGCAEAVHWLGERADVRRLMAASDLMLFPSLWEGLPGVVIEGTAAGLPVVASSIPAVMELAEELPSIRRVKLDQTDRVWAEECEGARVRFGSEVARARTRAGFTASRFTAARAAVEFRELWLGAQRDTRAEIGR